MNVHMCPEAEEMLEYLAVSLAIPESRKAERSYKDLGAWLNRPASRIRCAPQVHVQGSTGFREALEAKNQKQVLKQ